MKTINLGFSRPVKPTLFSKAIMWVDKTQYDHVFTKWNFDQIDRDLIYQASKMAVNFETNVTFPTHSLTVEEYELQISDEAFKKVLQFCFDNSNKDYGIKEILGFAWVKLNKLVNRVVNNPFPSNGSTWVCSVIATEILIIAGIITLDQPVENIDPLDLNTIIKAIPSIKRIS